MRSSLTVNTSLTTTVEDRPDPQLTQFDNFNRETQPLYSDRESLYLIVCGHYYNFLLRFYPSAGLKSAQSCCTNSAGPLLSSLTLSRTITILPRLVKMFHGLALVLNTPDTCPHKCVTLEIHRCQSRRVAEREEKHASDMRQAWVRLHL